MITKTKFDIEAINFSIGETFLVDKPINWSSFKVVHLIRKLFKVKKVGHAGTLDPRATGLLIISTGKKTKEITQYQDLPKTYTGKFILGVKTASMDLETEIIEEKSIEGISEELILQTKQTFVGKILQTPPMYSAVKVGGKALYKLARKGKTVPREPREVDVFSFNILNINLPEIEFEISCSKGTYIRVIVNDFGKKLGCGAVLSELRRIKIGNFSVNDALSVKELEDLSRKWRNYLTLNNLEENLSIN